MDRYVHTMKNFHETFMSVEGASLYHPIPLHSLHRGENTIRLTAYNGPSSNRDPLIYKRVELLMR